ncbi:MAG: response regulator [Rhabdochlamydiaceae bacterium]
MQKTTTCVLGNQKYETLKVDNKRLLVIHGQTPTTSYAIVPGWCVGNERYEKGQLTAIDVELVDPLDQVSLEDRIKRQLTRENKSPPRISFWGSGISDEEEEKFAEHPSTILVVDDDPALRDIIKMYLEKEGYKIRVASNASQAESVLREEIPSLMLVDIMMPDATGWQLLKKLEKDQKISKIPVIAISGLERPKDRAEEFDSKMLYDYLVKPFSLAELSRAVRKFAYA